MDYQPLNNMRYRIDLLQPSTEVDGAGQPADPVAFKSDIWANVEDLSGLALERAQLLSSEVNTRVTIYYDADVRAGFQVEHDGRTYLVGYVRDPGLPFRKMFSELLCRLIDEGV